MGVTSLDGTHVLVEQLLEAAAVVVVAGERFGRIPGLDAPLEPLDVDGAVEGTGRQGAGVAARPHRHVEGGPHGAVVRALHLRHRVVVAADDDAVAGPASLFPQHAVRVGRHALLGRVVELGTARRVLVGRREADLGLLEAAQVPV